MVAAPLANKALADPPREARAPAAPPASVAEAPGAPPPVAEQGTPRALSEPESPRWVEAGGAAGRALVYPPKAESPSPRPVTVLLHGMCGHPQSACGPFVDVATSRGWLVCPRGQDECGGGTRWRLRGGEDARLVDASVLALAQQRDGAVDRTAPRLIVGFSLGGTAAVQIAEASHGVYAGLVVIASLVHPDAGRLLRAGVKRVVLAAGDLDMTSAPLQEDARILARLGLPVRFVSLGRFGHGYPADMAERMREPMQWVAQGTEASTEGEGPRGRGSVNEAGAPVPDLE
jgi:predicted esterase